MVMCFMLASDAKEWLDSRRDELAAQSEENSEKRKKEQEAVCPCPYVLAHRLRGVDGYCGRLSSKDWPIVGC
jgi:hypothetical protein